MKQVVIENPIINSPFAEPERHFRFDDDGITNEIVESRRINSDLLLGDHLLKKMGAANLFTVFGEPDIEIQHQEDGKIVVTLHGLDIYDPTTGEIRSNFIDDIACWFIDTNYNGESFFVRHAYFTGADDPYSKLKRTLRTEIDESAWSALYSNVSRPFDPPTTANPAKSQSKSSTTTATKFLKSMRYNPF